MPATPAQHPQPSPQHNALSPQHNALSPQHNALSPQHNALSPQHNALSPQPSPQPASTAATDVITPQLAPQPAPVPEDATLDHPVPSEPTVPTEGGAPARPTPPESTPEHPVPSLPESTASSAGLRASRAGADAAEERRDLQHPVPSVPSSASAFGPEAVTHPTESIPTADGSIPGTDPVGAIRAQTWAVELPAHDVVLPTESAVSEPGTQEVLTQPSASGGASRPTPVLGQPEPSPASEGVLTETEQLAKRRRLDSEADATPAIVSADATPAVLSGDVTPTIAAAPPTILSGGADDVGADGA